MTDIAPDGGAVPPRPFTEPEGGETYVAHPPEGSTVAILGVSTAAALASAGEMASAIRRANEAIDMTSAGVFVTIPDDAVEVPERLMPAEPTFGTTVLALPDNLTIDQWADIGAQLATALTSTPWWVGDWLIYAHTHYETDDDGNAITTTGAAVRRHLAELGYEHETIDRYRRVAALFPPNARHEDLSWAHHSEVAGLDATDAHQLLNEASVEHWSTRELRERVRRLRAVEASAVDTLPGLAKPVRMSLVLTGVTDAGVIDRVEKRLNAVLSEFGIEGKVKVA